MTATREPPARRRLAAAAGYAVAIIVVSALGLQLEADRDPDRAAGITSTPVREPNGRETPGAPPSIGTGLLSAAQARGIAERFVAGRLGVPADFLEVHASGYVTAGEPPRRFWAAKILGRNGDGLAVYVDLRTAEALDASTFQRLTRVPAPTAEPALSPADRALLASLEPGETIQAALSGMPDRRAAFAAAAELGLEIVFGVVNDPSTALVVRGRPGPIVTLIERWPLDVVSLTEPSEALRLLAAPRPVPSSLIEASSPYRTFDAQEVTLRESGEPIDEAARDVILDSAPMLVQPLDGERYDHLDVTIACSRAGCIVIADGVSFDAFFNGAGGSDVWVLFASDETGWRSRRTDPVKIKGFEELREERFEAVPRQIARQAERVARLDPRTAILIAGYDHLSGFAWKPDPRGVVVVEYSRGGEGASMPTLEGHSIAVAGPMDYLRIDVNILESRVVRWQEVEVGPV